MRFVLALLLGLALASPSFGQSKSSGSPPAPAAGAPGYRMTRRDGHMYLIKRYMKQGTFYVVTDINGKNTSHLIDSVASIEPLTKEQLAEEGPHYETPGASKGPESARISARTSARTTARTKARAQDPEPKELEFSSIPDIPPARPAASSDSFTSSSGPGTTATGIPLHVGPRGGIYHYSKSGKKVYEKRK